MSEHSHSFWPKASDLKTTVSDDRRVDGVAEVTFENLLAPIKGRKQTGMAFKDEVNVFRRTLMYMGFPFSSRWYETASQENASVRDVLFLQRREGTSSRAFKKMIHETIASVLASSVGVTELRTQVYLPWSEKTWDTPNVSHDNPKGEQFHASIILGFASERARNAFYQDVAPRLNQEIIANTSAVFAYQMAETLTFVTNGKRQYS